MAQKKECVPQVSPSVSTSNLKIGAAEVDITPPIEVGFLASSVEKRWEPFSGVRRPLTASTLVLEPRGQRAAVLSTDTLGFAGEAVFGWERFVAEIARRAGGFVPGEMILTSTHAHSAPETLGLTECRHSPAYQRWLAGLERKLGECLDTAARQVRPARLHLAAGRTESLTLYRRIRTPQGIRLSHTFDQIDPQLLRDRPTDERVRCLVARDAATGAPIAFVAHAVCHPVYEMCLPEISPDYPGELRHLLQTRVAGVPVLFLQGAAGPINPWHVSGGSAYARRHAEAIFAALEPALQRLQPVAQDLQLRRATFPLPCRELPGEPIRTAVAAEISFLQLGDLACLFIPGEPFIETALALEEEARFPHLLVIGLSSASIGYIPPAKLFDEGGYEVGPGRWSYLARTAEAQLRKAIRTLARRASNRQGA